MRSFIKFLSFYLLLSVFISCSPKILPRLFKENPPNGIQISENFYCDRIEVSNVSWLEYMFWTERTFGEFSQEHLATFPDTNVWLKGDDNFEVYQEYYLTHPAYRNYPVVGIG